MVTAAADLDDTAFGETLARRTVEVLKRGRWFGDLNAIVRAHRDYTGHGLFHDHASGAFFLARSQDGLPDADTLIEFRSEEAFVAWLAEQSDLSLSGHTPCDIANFNCDAGNQRITRAFLLAELARSQAP